MNKNAEAELEDNQLSKVRNVALDVVATSHMIKSFTSSEERWVCTCFACNNLRKTPRLVDSIARRIANDDTLKREKRGSNVIVSRAEIYTKN